MRLYDSYLNIINRIINSTNIPIINKYVLLFGVSGLISHPDTSPAINAAAPTIKYGKNGPILFNQSFILYLFYTIQFSIFIVCLEYVLTTTSC